MFECKDCGANIEVPLDFQSDEIIGCEERARFSKFDKSINTNIAIYTSRYKRC